MLRNVALWERVKVVKTGEIGYIVGWDLVENGYGKKQLGVQLNNTGSRFFSSDEIDNLPHNKPTLNDIDFKNKIMCFDVDGVLAEYQFGDSLDIYACKDDKFKEYLNEHQDLYTNAIAPKKVLQFIYNECSLKNCYVISKKYSKLEGSLKIKFITSNYGIKPDHIYFVNKDSEKLAVMRAIADKENRPESKEVVIVDDSISVLGNISENSEFGTIHISSLLEYNSAN